MTNGNSYHAAITFDWDSMIGLVSKTEVYVHFFEEIKKEKVETKEPKIF